MRRIPTVLAAVLLAGATSSMASAQTAAPSAPATPIAPALAAVSKPSDEAVKEATALTEMIGVNRQAQQLIGIMRGQMVQLVMRAGNKQQDEAVRIVDQLLMPEFNSQATDLMAQIINVWASNFTIDDLKGLRDFYSTPLGQKLITTLPAVTQQGMAAGQAWGQKIYKDAIAKHKDELIAQGLKF